MAGSETPDSAQPVMDGWSPSLLLLSRIARALEQPVAVPPGTTQIPAHPTLMEALYLEIGALDRIAAAAERIASVVERASSGSSSS